MLIRLKCPNKSLNRTASTWRKWGGIGEVDYCGGTARPVSSDVMPKNNKMAATELEQPEWTGCAAVRLNHYFLAICFLSIFSWSKYLPDCNTKNGHLLLETLIESIIVIMGFVSGILLWRYKAYSLPTRLAIIASQLASVGMLVTVLYCLLFR